MSTIRTLRAERHEVARNTRNLLDQHPGKLWGPVQQKAYDKNLQQIEALDARIGHLEAADDASRARSLGVAEHDAPTELVRAWLRGKPTAEQMQGIRNTMSTGTGSQGGFTVPSSVSQQYVDTVKDFSGVRRVAQVIVTDSGEAMPWPTSDGTSETAELVAENATATAADPSFGSVALPTYRYSSKIITLPLELLNDSVIDIVQFVLDRVAARIGRLTNTHFTVGTGSGQPQGFAGAATVGKTGTTGQTLTVIHDDLVDLVHSVNAGYRQDPRGGVAFTMSDAAFKVVRKLKDSSARPLYLPSDGASPESVLGYPVNVNDDVAVPAANAKSIFFGNWRGYVVRDVRELMLFRFDDSAYTLKGQVAFLAFARAGGNLADTAAIRAYQHSAT